MLAVTVLITPSVAMPLQVGPVPELLIQLPHPPQLLLIQLPHLPQLLLMPRRRLLLQPQALPRLVKVQGRVARVRDRVAKAVRVVVAYERVNVNPALGVTTTELRDSRESVGPCGM